VLCTRAAPLPDSHLPSHCLEGSGLCYYDGLCWGMVQSQQDKKLMMRWRTVRKKLIASGHVEYFRVEIDSKVCSCLRLLSHPSQGASSPFGVLLHMSMFFSQVHPQMGRQTKKRR